MRWLFILITPGVFAAPFPSEGLDGPHTVNMSPQTGAFFVTEATESRTVFAMVTFFCAIVLSGLCGSYAETLKYNIFRKTDISSTLLAFLYFLAIVCAISITLVESGLGAKTRELCHAAAVICIVFGTGSKVTMYIFLLERIRVVRTPFVPRQKDGLWIALMIIICGGFGGISILAYTTPAIELSYLDARCRIGLSPRTSLPFMGFFVAVNIILTSVLLWLMKPMMTPHKLLSLRGIFGKSTGAKLNNWLGGLKGIGRGNAARYSGIQKKTLSKNVRILLLKCFMGSLLVMLITIANMIHIYVMKGRQLDWLCLTVCMVDISLCVVILHWVKMSSAKAENNLTDVMAQLMPCERMVPNLILPSPSPGGSVFDMGRPALLMDPGSLLTVDKAVTRVKRVP
ncbi:unnamed protein product [Periconia digitata]|uniref:G-protein coupled receptors family 3 profile domain-containing protein n=1 Tax=Periconia digitata TaxID=1303443 RepID=A0A9W4XMQ8_9PLEO|nr:unnamed protein product [Periconia digitata]